MKNTAPVDSELPPGPETQTRFGVNSHEGIEHLARCFNTALISTRAESQPTQTDELHSVVNSPAFREILEASRRLATSQGLSAQAAAESLIRAFRKVDQIWLNYVFSEGLTRIQGSSKDEPKS